MIEASGIIGIDKTLIVAHKLVANEITVGNGELDKVIKINFNINK